MTDYCLNKECFSKTSIKRYILVECKPGTSSKDENLANHATVENMELSVDTIVNVKSYELKDIHFGRNKICKNYFSATLMSTVEYMDEASSTNVNQQQSSESEHKNTASKEGLSSREVLVYSLGTAAFGITCTFMCIAFILFHRGKTRQLIEHLTIHSENQVNEDSNSCYSLYEIIDEDAIYDDNILDEYSEYSEDNYCKPESDGSTLNSEKSGYLLPFVTMIPNHGQEEHPYSKDEKSNGESSASSLSNHMEKYFKVINSYEQLHTEENKQSQSEYAHLHAVQYLELIDMKKAMQMIV
ncbi:unnamed protein product [Mytilus edulis]|uniref:Uncharacterized protein n=1 Tax=Mytilus edulis TaxID=6550 RepID=A0A8S3S0Y1_MYTED|nr:unnamed protein product [Mytilus edulis]